MRFGLMLVLLVLGGCGGSDAIADCTDPCTGGTLEATYSATEYRCVCATPMASGQYAGAVFKNAASGGNCDAQRAQWVKFVPTICN